ncbi:uncharacterized protein [Gossypium hirsutum]|uniref:Uncharacterized protein n=1 Tax=Gossypium hirsutum TaxID=3635 RepID=A0ABM2YMX6_GOSHI|nr:uncharacterized protein LOC107921349 [Gossypium hirsutum]
MQPAFVYAARRQEDRDALKIIIGTFFIFDVPYTALIDLGSTHSYVVNSVSKNLEISIKSTFNKIIVLSPSGQSVQVNKLYRDVSLVVQEAIFLANLMELPFKEFDLILGYEAYLAYVSVSISKDSFLGDIRTVRDFLNVFPEELPSLLLNREVEFGIELLPGRALVSIAPNRMASKDLIELKAQLQKLLGLGFICPIVSPWGHQFCLLRKRMGPLGCLLIIGN